MPKIHATAIVQGVPDETRARCGWLHVQTSTDTSRVTCKVCRRLAEAGTTRDARAPRKVPAGLLERLGTALQVEGVPTAPPPPILDPPSWQSVCKPSEEAPGRCGKCVLCEYERDLERYAALDPYRVRQRLERDPTAPVFGSLSAALLALAQWRSYDRQTMSHTGKVLERLRLGQTGGGSPRAGSKLLDRANDIAHVDVAVRAAYEAGDNAAHLPPNMAEVLLLLRTPGVVRGTMPTYVDLAAELLEDDRLATPRELKRTVRHGRRYVTVELAARGLVRWPDPKAGLAEAIWDREQQLGRVG